MFRLARRAEEPSLSTEVGGGGLGSCERKSSATWILFLKTLLVRDFPQLLHTRRQRSASGIGVACLPSDPLRCVSPRVRDRYRSGRMERAAIGWSDPADATCFYLRLGARRPRCEPVRTKRTQLGAPYNLPLAPGVPPLPPCPARPVPLPCSDRTQFGQDFNTFRGE